MPIDGVFLSHLTRELSSDLVGARLDKINQPEASELRLQFRTVSGGRKTLLLSARPGSARLHFTETKRDNPDVPPMLCMLARKLLAGARVLSVTQPGSERMVDIALSAYDDFGDPCTRHIIFELAGRIPNILLTDGEMRITDCVRRVNIEDKQANRPMLPGLLYRPPMPPEGKKDILSASSEDIAEVLSKGTRTAPDTILDFFCGISPLVARELCQNSPDTAPENWLPEERFSLANKIADAISAPAAPCALTDSSGKITGYSFMPISQYGELYSFHSFGTCSELLDFCCSSSGGDTALVSAISELIKPVKSARSRLERKLAIQRTELAATFERERLREKGDILNAFLSEVPKGASSVTLPDLYSAEGGDVEIELDPKLSPQRNAQKYYSEYRRLKSAKAHLEELISDGEKELEYLSSVIYQISAADAKSLPVIKAELGEDGILKKAKGSDKKKSKPLPPKEFKISNGMTVLCGRTARQNEELTFRVAAKNDWWFHVKNAPGSHCILVCNGEEPTDSAYEEAAAIAAANSSVAGAGHIAVDYTIVRFLKKMPGGKPGMVIYDKYYTLYTD
ncbi:MAG: NFACT family protein [Oscillospiraceae bacterium]|nr:NFACT family protein [Oscillospiraceae bacterium]